MAKPQKEDGHVDIANEIVEALAKIQLSGYESRVLWIIFRKTYGWHKKEDWITNTQIADMTGIAEAHVSRTIKLLNQKNIVTKRGKKLSFQKDYDEWIKLPKGDNTHTYKKLPKGDNNIPKGVNEYTKRGKNNIPKGVYTKETKRNYTKETIQKKSIFFQKAWKNFKEMRKAKNKKMTPRAKELIINELNKLAIDEKTQVAILDQSIMNSWQGVFPLKGNQKGGDFEYQKYEPKKVSNEEMEKYKNIAKEGIKILRGNNKVK